jgi:hypothetical protein
MVDEVKNDAVVGNNISEEGVTKEVTEDTTTDITGDTTSAEGAEETVNVVAENDEGGDFIGPSVEASKYAEGVKAEAKVDIDYSKYKYRPITDEEIEKSNLSYSCLSAVGRPYLNNLFAEIVITLESIEYALRHEQLSLQESRELNKRYKQLKAIIEPYARVKNSISQGEGSVSTLVDGRGDIKNGIAFGEGNNVRMMVGKPPKVDLSKANNPNVFFNVITTALGSASEIRFPLPASGFSLTLSAPSKPEIIGMLSRINRIEKKRGRESMGYTYTATIAESLQEVLDVFLAPSRIKRCSLDIPVEDIQYHIKRSDVDILIAHFAWLVYPTGYKYVLECLNYVNKPTGVEGDAKEEPCDYKEEATVNILDMIWYDNSRLTIKQRNLLANSQHSLSDIADYQRQSEEGYLKEYSSFDIIPESGQVDKITINLKCPSLVESIDSDKKWLIKLDNYIDQAGATSLDDDSVQELAERISMSMHMSIYATYIDSITLEYVNDSGEKQVATNSDFETIDSILSYMASNDNCLELINQKVSEYMERCRIGFMGIPNKNCPSCKKPQPQEIEGIKLIPVNPLKDFFTACHIKMM